MVCYCPCVVVCVGIVVTYVSPVPSSPASSPCPWSFCLRRIRPACPCRCWLANDDEARQSAETSIRKMMEQIQTLWPRRDGLCWNLTKLHEQFHVPMDIQRMGRHRNVHTGPQEHNHLDIKHAAQKTQMNKKKLDLQTGCRVMERLIIQRAYDFRTRETMKLE